MDEALKAGTSRGRRRGRGIELESAADAEIAEMSKRMAEACQADAAARSKGEPATHKLAILPAVVELMNRNTIQSQLADPDSDILQAVRFMLEPADHDAALPNYKIQRELFAILGKLTIGKEALKSSGLGKVVLFYTRSSQPQQDIKRAAEKLLGEWMRVVLKRHTNRNPNTTNIPTRTYDPTQQSRAAGGQQDPAALLRERRRKALELQQPGNRARVDGQVGTYTIAPVSNLAGIGAGQRAVGRSGEEAFRRMIARATSAKQKK